MSARGTGRSRNARAEKRAAVKNDALKIATIMSVTLSVDHRVIDGAEGVRFTSYLRQLLGDIRRLLL